jgi:glycosyltransferase involved in cell wall biosynthesis
MKLLILDQFSDRGGAQQNILDLLPALRECGWDAVVGLPGDGELFDAVRAAGFAADRLECGPYTCGSKSLKDVARFLSETPRLARRIRAISADADLVYINGPRLLPAAALAGIDAPVVFHAHSFLPPGMSRRLARHAARHLNARVIANCEFVARPWRQSGAEVSVLMNGVRASRRLSARDGRTLGCMGRIAPEKGQLEFVAAAKTICQQAPDCRFVVHGAPLFSADAYEREVRARAATLPIEFAGWTDDVDEALSKMDVLLVPSSPVEATTRVILEAYAAGTPVVAFANGGIPEVLEHGRTGFLARSTDEMARYAVALLRDPGMRAEMAVAARECWARRFTLERYRREIVAELEKCLRPALPARPLRPAWGRSRSA